MAAAPKAPWVPPRLRKQYAEASATAVKMEEVKEETEDVPPWKKKKVEKKELPKPKPALSKDKLLEELAAKDQDASSASEKRRKLLEELAATEKQERLAARQKQKLLEELAEREEEDRLAEEEQQRKFAEEQEHARNMAEGEERRRKELEEKNAQEWREREDRLKAEREENANLATQLAASLLAHQSQLAVQAGIKRPTPKPPPPPPPPHAQSQSAAWGSASSGESQGPSRDTDMKAPRPKWAPRRDDWEARSSDSAWNWGSEESGWEAQGKGWQPKETPQESSKLLAVCVPKAYTKSRVPEEDVSMKTELEDEQWGPGADEGTVLGETDDMNDSPGRIASLLKELEDCKRVSAEAPAPRVVPPPPKKIQGQVVPPSVKGKNLQGQDVSGARVVPPSNFENVEISKKPTPRVIRPACAEVSRVFEAGKIGMILDDTSGTVVELRDGQAKELLVEEGWICKHIDDLLFTPELLKEKVSGTKSYEALFMIPQRSALPTTWTVLPHRIIVRATKDVKSGVELGEKLQGEVIVGRREGNWLALDEERGYLQIKEDDASYLELHVKSAYDNKELDIVYKKTQLCMYHPSCHRGDKCTFAHGEEELGKDQPPPRLSGLPYGSVEATHPGNIVIKDAMYTGTVKQFGPGAGFAFITSDEIKGVFGKDVFVTARELEFLAPGQKVSFRVELHKGKAQAFDIVHLDKKERDFKYKKTKMCLFWGHGPCPNGDNCPFAHGDGDLGTDRGADAVPLVSGANEDRCFDFLRGVECKHGDECPFRHGEEPPTPKSDKPCREFQKGVCKRENCRFMHDEWVSKPGKYANRLKR